MSSGSDSDDDYKPCEPEAVSEEDSADDETDLQYEKELETKRIKRKNKLDVQTKKRRKIKHNSFKKDSIHIEDESAKTEMDPEEEKKKEDELWMKFLEGTNTKPKEKNENSMCSANSLEHENSYPNDSQNTSKTPAKEENEARERRIFEFAGEKIIVEDNVIKEKIKVSENTTLENILVAPPQKRTKSGISNVLNIINKKSQLSTLEKSKLDWETYKKDEGIEEEVQNINKGKAGYLDRQDFLERTDMRQYELERDLRLSRRSNR